MKEEAVNFIKNLEKKVKIISHNDADGICSAAILARVLKERGVAYDYEFTEVPIEHISKQNTMIFTDITLESAIKFLSEKTLIIDHHQFKERPNIPFYNPREVDENSYIPASYLVYEVCSEIEKIKDLEWLAAIGIIGDKGDLNSEMCKKFVDKFPNREELTLLSDYIFSATLVDHLEGCEKSLEILISASSEKDVLENIYLRDCYDEVQSELAKSGKKIEKDDSIIFVEVSSKFNLKSIVASQMLDKYKNSIVVAYSPFEESYNMSIRTNININLGEIIKKIAKDCGGDGGGHEKAAGARIKKEKFSVFKEELISEVEKQ